MFVMALFMFAAQDPVQELRDEVQRMREEYEQRIAQLESRIELLQMDVEDAQAPPPPPQQERINELNPAITVFSNMTYRADSRTDRNEDGDRVDNRFSLRESEIDFRAPITPGVNGLLIMAAEEEVPSEFEFTIEEAYATVHRIPGTFYEDPPWGLNFKVGRFRTEFGRNNILHTHDMPQTTRPLVVREFLGEEGAVGDGLSASAFLPSDWLDERSTFTLTGQAWSGEIASSDERRMQGLVNLNWSRAFGDSHRVDLAAIAHWGETTGDMGTHPVSTYSLDALYSWRPAGQATYRGFVLGGQYFWGDRRFETAAADGTPITESRTPRGYYAFGQYQFNRNLFAGVRYDWTETLNSRSGESEAIFPYLSWYATEFLRLRLGWEHTWFEDLGTPDLDTLWVELNWIFGSHPAEPYWVHR